MLDDRSFVSSLDASPIASSDWSSSFSNLFATASPANEKRLLEE